MVKRIFLASLLICLVVGTAMAQRETARGHIEQGQAHMAAGRFAEAVASFEAALRLEPRNRQAPALLEQAKQREEARKQQESNDQQAFARISIRSEIAGEILLNGEGIGNRRIAAEGTNNFSMRVTVGDIITFAIRDAAGNIFEAAPITVNREDRNLVVGAEQVNREINRVRPGNETVPTTYTFNIRRPVSETPVTPGPEYFDIVQNSQGGITITNFKNDVSQERIVNLVIPATLYGQRVTIINSGAFESKGITSVVFPDTVITINGFSGNRLRTITFGNGLREIGVNAFAEPYAVPEGASFASQRELRRRLAGESITELVIPDSVTSIGGRAFIKNTDLTTLKLGNNVQTIGAGAFQDCALTSLELPVSLQTIGNSAFQNNKLTSVVIPQGVTTIGSSAFENNSLVSVVIMEGVTSIGSRAFAGNPLTELVIPSSLVKPASTAVFQVRANINNVFPQTLTRVTLPQGLQDTEMRDFNFESNLINFYNSHNKAAGTYVKNGPVWTIQPTGLQ